MEKHKARKYIWFLLLMVVCSMLYGRVIELKNGEIIKGEIIREENEQIIIELEQYGQITVPKEDIKFDSMYPGDYHTAEVLFLKGEYVDAIALYQKIFESPETIVGKNEILGRIADSYFNLGEWDKALLGYNKIVKLAKEESFDLHCQIRVAYCLLKLNKKADNEVSITAISPEQVGKKDIPYYFFLKGMDCLKNEDYENAVFSFLSIDVFYSEYKNVVLESKLMAARCFEKLDRREFAQNLYKEIYSESPLTDYGKKAYEKMDKR